MIIFSYPDEFCDWLKLFSTLIKPEAQHNINTTGLVMVIIKQIRKSLSVSMQTDKNLMLKSQGA